MRKGDVEIINQKGLHARAAAKLVNMAASFESEVFLTKDGNEVNGKSILGLLMLAAQQGSIISLTTDGPDEGEAFEKLVGLINNKFEEPS
jgi:phosphocarrier protein